MISAIPFFHIWLSNLLWQTICGFLYRWHHSWGCHIAWSDLPEEDSSEDLSDQSWSVRGIVPRNISINILIDSFIHTHTILRQKRICATWPHLSRHYLLIDLNGLVGKKWRISSCHFIYQDTKGPPVNSLVVTLN